MRKFKFRLDKKTDKKIISMAWPSIMEQILEMMVGMVSIIFMGRIGTDAVAAVGMVKPATPGALAAPETAPSLPTSSMVFAA